MQVLTDEPEWSSAALCITLNLLGKSFRPEYTHQCLENEVIPGYQPMETVVMEAISTFQKQQQQKDTKATTINSNNNNDNYTNNINDNNNNKRILLHKSHSSHDTASKQLNLTITLSPSCHKCNINFDIQPKSTTTITTKSDCKDNNNETNDNEDKEEEPALKKQKIEENEEVAETIPMTAAEIKEAISKALPDILNTNCSDDDDYYYLQEPIGIVLKEYTTTTTAINANINTTINSTNDEDHGTTNQNDASSSTTAATANTTTTSNEQHFCLTLADGSWTPKSSLNNNSSSNNNNNNNKADIQSKNNDSNHHHYGTISTKAYHDRVQKLALWFIENADDVNVSNNNDSNNNQNESSLSSSSSSSSSSGFWKVLYLFQKHSRSKATTETATTNTTTNTTTNSNIQYFQYSLVGYITLFHFTAPFHKPNPGIIVRICQALVFPPYQGQGHGKQMMQAVYDLAHDKYNTATSTTTTTSSGIVLVNVEDPAPAFVALRNKMDLTLLTNHSEWWDAIHDKNNDNTKITSEGYFTALSESDALKMGGLAKITPRQVQIVNELIKLRALQEYSTTTTTDNNNDNTNNNNKEQIAILEDLNTKFRLMVKRRLNKEHAEEMSTYSTKERKKAYLADLYNDQMKHYELLLKSSSSSSSTKTFKR